MVLNAVVDMAAVTSIKPFLVNRFSMYIHNFWPCVLWFLGFLIITGHAASSYITTRLLCLFIQSNVPNGTSSRDHYHCGLHFLGRCAGAAFSASGRMDVY